MNINIRNFYSEGSMLLEEAGSHVGWFQHRIQSSGGLFVINLLVWGFGYGSNHRGSIPGKAEFLSSSHHLDKFCSEYQVYF
jgi:hypothetical protein